MTEVSASQPAQRKVTDLIVLDFDGRNDHAVAFLTLNRPRQRNPLDVSTVASLRSCLHKLTAAYGPAAIIITGAGSAFSSGGDLKGYQELYRRPAEFRAFMSNFAEVCTMLEESSAITVAMVNGTCVAGGLELALACDFITIAETARIGDGHLRFGQLPGGGGTQRLVRAIGVQQAKLWLLSGQLYTAAEAVNTGLALEAVPDEQLRERTMQIITPSLGHSALAVREMKMLLRVANGTSLNKGLAVERDVVLRYATQSHDATEGLHAFAERRSPNYLGK